MSDDPQGNETEQDSGWFRGLNRWKRVSIIAAPVVFMLAFIWDYSFGEEEIRSEALYLFTAIGIIIGLVADNIFFRRKGVGK